MVNKMLLLISDTKSLANRQKWRKRGIETTKELTQFIQQLSNTLINFVFILFKPTPFEWITVILYLCSVLLDFNKLFVDVIIIIIVLLGKVLCIIIIAIIIILNSTWNIMATGIHVN